MKTIIKFIKKLLRQSKKQSSSINSKFIIERPNHNISQTDISPKALEVLEKLDKAGYQAYLVGGGVRDLLVKKAPKDFDIATDATPNQIRSLFRNARIIGRRFKLVHILYYREIIEVATFRGHSNPQENQKTNERGMLVRDNVFGSLDEDAMRRDFTINSLYYNIKDSSIVDFTSGFQDIQNKLIRIIGDPTTRYTEDPVRMLRALRFCAKLDFKLEDKTAAPIKELSHLIKDVPSSRLFEEMSKIYHCGTGESIQKLMVEYGFFQYLFALTYSLWDSQYPVSAFIIIALENTDRRIMDGKPVNPAFFFAVALWFPVLDKARDLRANGIDPLPALDQAMSYVISQQNMSVNIPKRYTIAMREIWLLQHRFANRAGGRAARLLQHPRFRAAYDFLALRALSGDAEIELADWWTKYQDVDEKSRLKMIADLPQSSPNKKKRRKKPKTAI